MVPAGSLCPLLHTLMSPLELWHLRPGAALPRRPSLRPSRPSHPLAFAPPPFAPFALFGAAALLCTLRTLRRLLARSAPFGALWRRRVRGAASALPAPFAALFAPAAPSRFLCALRRAAPAPGKKFLKNLEGSLRSGGPRRERETASLGAISGLSGVVLACFLVDSRSLPTPWQGVHGEFWSSAPPLRWFQLAPFAPFCTR